MWKGQFIPKIHVCNDVENVCEGQTVHKIYNYDYKMTKYFCVEKNWFAVNQCNLGDQTVVIQCFCI